MRCDRRGFKVASANGAYRKLNYRKNAFTKCLVVLTGFVCACAPIFPGMRRIERQRNSMNHGIMNIMCLDQLRIYWFITPFRAQRTCNKMVSIELRIWVFSIVYSPNRRDRMDSMISSDCDYSCCELNMNAKRSIIHTRCDWIISIRTKSIEGNHSVWLWLVFDKLPIESTSIYQYFLVIIELYQLSRLPGKKSHSLIFKSCLYCSPVLIKSWIHTCMCIDQSSLRFIQQAHFIFHSENVK